MVAKLSQCLGIHTMGFRGGRNAGNAMGGAELGRGGQGVIETMNRLPDFVHGAEEVQLVYVDLRTGKERRRVVSTRLLASMVPGAVFKLPLEENRRRPVFGGNANNGRAPQPGAAAVQNTRAANSTNSNPPKNANVTRNVVPNVTRNVVPNVTRNVVPNVAPNAATRSPGSNANGSLHQTRPSTLFSPPQLEQQQHETRDPIREEFEGNLRLANTIALGNVGRRKHVKVLSTNTPFLVREDRFMVIGVIAGDEDSPDDCEYFPIYRRMGGNLSDFYKRFPQDATLALALESTRACLDVLELLISVGAHHCDIKEENMLYDIVCSNGNNDANKNKRPRRTTAEYPPPCRVDFAVSDFGLVRIRPTHISNRGTPGSICPLTYANNDKGRTEYEIDHILSSRIATASAVWDSYERERASPTQRATSPSSVHEKADLFAVGVMLIRFAKLEGGDDPAVDRRRRRPRGVRDPLRMMDGDDSSAATREAVREYAIKLLRGDRGSIWTIERAQKALSKLMAPARALASKSRKVTTSHASQASPMASPMASPVTSEPLTRRRRTQTTPD